MKISDLIFVGIRGSVVALNRATGQPVWAKRLKGYDFVNIVVEEGKLLATAYGEIFCLDPFTGETLWHNPLKGYGVGLAAIATEATGQTALTAAMAAKRRADQNSASAAAAASGVVA